MTRDKIMRDRLFCKEVLDNPNSTECDRLAAEIALRNLPQVPRDFFSYREQPEEQRQ